MLKQWQSGLSLRNSNGDVDAATTGFDYARRTVTALRARVIKQKFYQIPPADYFSVVVGTGAWMEEIQTKLSYDVSGPFETGIISTAQDFPQLPRVGVALSPKTIKIATFAKGYQYSVPELEKALAANNWNTVESKNEALKRHWDLGIQKVGFLGVAGQAASFPGLLTNPDVSVDTSVIGEKISGMTAEEFATFVATIVGVYQENANYTAYPDTFLIPASDYNGLATPVASGFPFVSKLTYLQDAFKVATSNQGFRIMPLAYGDAARNAGYVSVGGKYRYVLYRNDLETVAMDIPVPFNLLAPNTSDNFYWNGVGCGQFTGCWVYRPREVMYFDHS